VHENADDIYAIYSEWMSHHRKTGQKIVDFWQAGTENGKKTF
jgi:hypothetical protein